MYVIYNDLGEIKKVITCQPEHAPTGDNVLEAEYCFPRLQYVSNGVLTNYSETQLTAKMQRPSYWHEWNNVTMSWYDPRE
jgi:hypothetical protein